MCGIGEARAAAQLVVGGLAIPTYAGCRRAQASQGRALKGGRQEAASLDRPCARRLPDLAVGTEECSRRGSNQRMAPASEGAMFAEQVELPRVVVMFGCNRLVVTAYLSEMGFLELEGDLHQGVRSISGGFIGDDIFGRWG